MEKKRTDTAVLRMHCPDQPGIIAVITEFITSNRGNILYLDQYVDRAAGIFYMRVEWDIAAHGHICVQDVTLSL